MPLKTIQERPSHALSGSLTLDVYTQAKLPGSGEAAVLAGERIEKAVNSVSLTTNQEKGFRLERPSRQLAGFLTTREFAANQLEKSC